MIHYTPFPTEWQFYAETQQVEQYTVQWQNVPMVVQRDAQHGVTIVQLLSCDPQDYLHPHLQPGMPVELTLPVH